MESDSSRTPEYGTQDFDGMPILTLVDLGRKSASEITSRVVIHELERRALGDNDPLTTTRIEFGLIVAHERILDLERFQGPEFEDNIENED